MGSKRPSPRLPTRFMGLRSRSSRYSTLQDLDAKRPTEIESLAGDLIRMARELGVAVPCIEFVYHTVKALEEKNRGIFDY